MSFTIVGILGFIIHDKYIKTLQKKENIIYKLIYYDDSELESKIEINIYDDTLEIINLNFCSDVDCKEPQQKKETFNYSKENMNKLKQFIKNSFSISNNQRIEINKNELNKYQKEVM